MTMCLLSPRSDCWKIDEGTEGLAIIANAVFYRHDYWLPLHRQ